MKIRLELGGRWGLQGEPGMGEMSPLFRPSLQPPPLRSPRKSKREEKEKKNNAWRATKRKKNLQGRKKKNFYFSRFANAPP